MEKKTLGTVISTLRKERNMTQKELAAKLHITDKAVSKWERDLACPDINTLPLLAEQLGVSVDTLLSSGTTDRAPAEDIQKIAAVALKAVAMGMGIAVTTLSALGKLQIQTGITMLGVGLASLGLYLFSKPE
ncbi:MAG: helix-turn-helix transcriptional regulator [Clostridia bacterium]|nr:helix-turn-helix transcriptional regulator [Clostridia bacterium]